MANDESVILGGSSLDVTFNLCPSSDPDPGDELKFWYDYDGDGKADEWGHCRATHHYQVKEFDSACVFTKVCVSDRQAEHAVCNTYEVCTYGKPRPNASPSPSGSPGPSPSTEPTPSPITEQSVSGDLDLDRQRTSRDAWSFTAVAETHVTVSVNKIAAESGPAYVLVTCISTSPRRRDCVRPQSRNDGQREATLHQAGVYYVVVSGFRLVKKVNAQYTVQMTASPGTGPLELVVDNVTDEDPIEE